VIFVRPSETDPPKGVPPPDLATFAPGVRADSLVSLREEGPFEPLAVAVEEQGALRDRLAAAFPIPALRTWSRDRFIALGLGLVPALMLLELDREHIAANIADPSKLIVDFVLAGYVAFETTRKTPRRPLVASLCLVTLALRWLFVTTRLCYKNVPALVILGVALSVAAAVFSFVRFPSRARVALELLDKLGIAPADAQAAKRDAERAPTSSAFNASIAAAAGLPIALYLMRNAHVDLFVQAGFFAAYGALVPLAVKRFTADPKDTTRSPSSPQPRAILSGIAVGLALTAAVVTGVYLFTHTGAELARCVGRLDAEAKKALAAEAAELAKTIAQVKASRLLVVLTAIVFPFAEERIYRGVLQHTMVKKYGVAYGVFAGAAGFAAAHYGVYHAALYQTILLGIGFGVAYLEGGIVAAFVVHATWNLLQLM
jgi:membrane protease YdiL (CAAX protease family)